jgi:hypothetical protein
MATETLYYHEFPVRKLLEPYMKRERMFNIWTLEIACMFIPDCGVANALSVYLELKIYAHI